MTNLASINGHRNGYAKFAAQRNLELMTRLGWDPDTLTAAEINWLVGDNVIPLRAPSNGALQPDRNEAERFLTLLDPKATYFTFQTFDDDQERREARKQDLAETNAKRVAKGLHPLKLKDPFAHIVHGTLDECWDQLDRLNEQGAGIFITVNATDGKGRCKENIQQVRALFNDLDGEPLEPVLQSQQPPHIVVESSPGHFHPYRLVGGVALDQFEPLQKKLIAEFGGDDVHDLPRVMRMPGFIHRKNKDKPSLVHIVSTHEGPLYSAKDFGVVDGGNGKEPVGPYGKMRDQAKRSPTKQLNDAAMANLKAWVPELFPTAGEYHDGFRVTSADLGRDNDEDLSIVPEGIKDFGVHDLDDPREGKRTPIDIVMESGSRRSN